MLLARHEELLPPALSSQNSGLVSTAEAKDSKLHFRGMIKWGEGWSLNLDSTTSLVEEPLTMYLISLNLSLLICDM